MSARLRTTVLLASTAAVGLPLLAACGGSDDDGGTTSGSASTVSVQAGDNTCELDRTELEAGSTTFAVTNTGSTVTEVYVYGDSGSGEFTKVISEVENIGPGTSRDMTVDLGTGEYEIACKPGQTGDGIRTAVTVAGGDAAAGAEESAEAAYDREIELATDGSSITGLEGGATAGETIEFKLTNSADAPRVLELKAPDGSVAGESAPVPPGETGEVIVELAEAGTWTVVVEGEGVADLTVELAVS
jgi:uncharacterized cupredoxin-like copper-binding protein